MDQLNSKTLILSTALGVVLAVTLILIAVSERYFPEIRQQWVQGERVLLRKIVFPRPSGNIDVIFVSQDHQIFLEAYHADDSIAFQRKPLGVKRLSSIEIDGVFESVHVIDINQDNNFEIVLAVMDENLVPRLQVFQWDETLQGFTLSPLDSLDF